MLWFLKVSLIFQIFIYLLKFTRLKAWIVDIKEENSLNYSHTLFIHVHANPLHLIANIYAKFGNFFSFTETTLFCMPWFNLDPSRKATLHQWP
jgi:hypothetical protein